MVDSHAEIPVPPEGSHIQSPSEQSSEQDRRVIQRTIDVVSVNMIDLDGYKDINRLSGVLIYQGLKRSLADLPERLEIFDRFSIANAQNTANQLLEEINRRRAERGEPPAETVFEQKQTTIALPPLTSITESADLVQLSINLAEAIIDIPHVFPEKFDRNNALWGRVNVLHHDGVIYGVSDVGAVFDQNREIIITERQLYQNGRHVGSWEQSILYFRNVAMGRDLPKKLASYSETVTDGNNTGIEKIEVGFDIDGRVFNVYKTHFTNGEPSGTSQLHFTYDRDGHVYEVTQTKLDPSGKILNEERKPYAAASGQASLPEEPVKADKSHQAVSSTPANLPQKEGAGSGVVPRLRRLFHGGK